MEQVGSDFQGNETREGSETMEHEVSLSQGSKRKTED